MKDAVRGVGSGMWEGFVENSGKSYAAAQVNSCGVPSVGDGGG